MAHAGTRASQGGNRGLARGTNGGTKVYDELPFGGVKSSGFGKEHGSEAFDFYTDQKSVVIKRRPPE